ncbi:hypothetical protein LCI18_014390 [Fusarium solani-melongenae]|uniref:Uncharacterized protein n=1 Tax=Fusarium solani subsp. cucurbitae TaxID=2747967 RepID=A0ACD3ZQF3_FUSSC|nr:hypothetical protein LCI18_014390 [Fusarium solani-melongenae]
MAEAFGIASGVTGVVSLGLTYLDAIKDRDEDIKYASQCSRLLTQLRGHIDLFDINARTLSSRYAISADLVVKALQLCEGELRDFEAIINTLKPGNGSAWSKTKSAATYPFNQSKLKQVQDRLYRATTILGTVANDLVRHDVASLRDDVAAIKNALQGESDDRLRIEETLRRLSTKVEDISASVAPAAPMLTEVLTEV